MHYTKEYVESLIKDLELTRKELNDLKQSCKFCGTYICDECIEEMSNNV